MKRKIQLHYALLTIVAICLTLIATTFVYYGVLKKEVFDGLRIYSTILEQTIEQQKNDALLEYHIEEQDIRITLMDEYGDVLYDNQVSANELENHASRPEVIEAMEHGVGSAVRHSDTIGKNIFYYCIEMEDGLILRVARQSDSVWHILNQAFPTIFIILMILALISILFATVLTQKIITPIERLANNMDNTEGISTYKELDPFLNMIRQQHEDIVKSAKMRQEFTANVSHELKTPLTSISGYSELIQNGMVDEKDTLRFAGEIHKNAQRLLVLINDILRLSELDTSSGETFTTNELVDLYTLSENCINMLELNAKNHQVELKLSGEHLSVYGDRRMLDELIYNLCDNGIRYNNPGGMVHVHIQAKEQGVELVVRDTGIGISEKHQERIFERFYRVDKSRSKSTGGTGLGLAIVKHIVSRHNAQLRLESELGRGTTIFIYFDNKMDSI